MLLGGFRLALPANPMTSQTHDERFCVYQFFPDGSNERVGEWLPAEEAVKLAYSYTTRPAALLGIIQQVMITDAGDNCVFHWRSGEGVIFPEPGSKSDGIA